MAGLLLSELDQSMVAAALPTIVDELDGVGDLMWVNTAYLLAATACCRCTARSATGGVVAR